MHRCQWGVYVYVGKTSALQLNPSKAEIGLIWFGSRVNLSKFSATKLSLKIGNDIIMPGDAIRDLGVIFDSELSM